MPGKTRKITMKTPKAARFGAPSYNRLQAAATSAESGVYKLCSGNGERQHAGRRPITARLTAAPGNGASIGGLR
ncbi:hypothetical protein KCP73_03920 [Salmonella enterica subsp. enterica]|nr:hypothetical protein KCP73_03920 [Salmonella enterica subsp. enterica]